MAFGQQSGSPATGKQVQELLSLLQAAGHSDFRDARGPMGFSQRQAGGKFTRDEATAFIAQLQEPDDGSPAGGAPIATPARAMPKRLSSAEQALVRVPSSLLAAELQSRGWIVVEP
jgi:hypothetical protein